MGNSEDNIDLAMECWVLDFKLQMALAKKRNWSLQTLFHRLGLEY